jgi:6-phosphogluconolactonase
MTTTGTGTGDESSIHYLLFVGTYTDRGSDGIYVFRFTEKDGNLSPMGLAARAINPSSLAIVRSANPHSKVVGLLSVQETSEATDGLQGGVVSYAVDDSSGNLQVVDRAPSHGDGPCSITLDDTGRYAFVANFWGGTVAVLPITADLRFNMATTVIQTFCPLRFVPPRPHAFQTIPGNRFAIIAELGTDRLLTYPFDARTGRIEATEPFAFELKTGSGPRHMAFLNNGRILYVVNEIACTVAALLVEDDGRLQLLQTISTLEDGTRLPGDAAEVIVHPNGRFLYASTRRPSTICLYRIDSTCGRLSFVCDYASGGDSPAVFAIAPSGRWLIVGNQSSGNLAVFPIDPSTGLLGKLRLATPLSSPSSIVFFPTSI